jgi:hypothetical protein
MDKIEIHSGGYGLTKFAWRQECQKDEKSLTLGSKILQLCLLHSVNHGSAVTICSSISVASNSGS